MLTDYIDISRAYQYFNCTQNGNLTVYAQNKSATTVVFVLYAREEQNIVRVEETSSPWEAVNILNRFIGWMS